MDLDKDQLIFGRHPIMEALNSGRGFEKLFVLKTAKGDDLQDITKLARKKGIQVQFVPIQKLNTLTRKNHQGVVGFASIIPYYEVEDVLMQVYDKGETPLFVMLDEVTDVRNFGAIARTAECCGAHALIIPVKGSANINADAMKASAGALHHIPVCKVRSLKEAADHLKLNGIKILAADIGTDKMLYDTELTVPVTVIMGSEGSGVSKALLELTDEVFTIPMTGVTESLNVSVSAGMVLYEAVRQRKLNPVS